MERWRRLWERAGARARLAVVLPLLVFLAACEVDLYTGLGEREANEMIAVLARYDIQATKATGPDGDFAVRVAKARFSDAVHHLDSNGLPRDEFVSIGDVFKKEGLISSPVEERARFIYALSQELSRTLMEIEGVVTARIHVVLPKNDPLHKDLTPSSASVFIRHRADASLDAVIPQIKMLVSNSIEGLVYDQVSVAMFPASEVADPRVATPQFERVAGFWVHPSSAAHLWLLLGGIGGLVVLSGGFAGFRLARRHGVVGSDKRSALQSDERGLLS